MLRFFIIKFILITSLYAHPHTFIDVYPKISHKQDLITSINLSWKFDAMTSQLLMMEFDQNMDGKIDKEENQYIKINYFQPLEDYGFYTDIRIKGKSTVTKAKNFKASIDKEQRIVYQFDVDINQDKKDFYIDFYDEENFTAFVLKKEFVTCTIPFQIVDVDNDFYFAYRLQFQG